MAKTIELTPIQAKFLKGVVKMIAEDKELLEFFCTPRSGKSTILKILDEKVHFMSNRPEINKDY